MLRCEVYEENAEKFVAGWLDGYLVLYDFDA